MKVVLHDRTGGLAPELHEYAQRKLARLERHFGRVAEAEVEFSEERKRSGLATSICRINLHLDGRRSPVLTARESGADAQAALDLALDKIDRQVLKLKERRRDRRAVAPAEIAVSLNGSGVPKPAEMDIVRRHLKSESVDEAADRLEADGAQFHLFLNEDSGEVNVIYRRADGGLRVIEPVLK